MTDYLVSEEELFNGKPIRIDTDGYPYITIKGKKTYLHIYVWEKTFGEHPKGCEIHHKDLDKANYKLNNLELMTKGNHKKLHKGWVNKNKVWIKKPCSYCGKILDLDNFYTCHKANTKTTYLSSICKKCIAEKSKIEYKLKSTNINY